jgi:hypothetical protein
MDEYISGLRSELSRCLVNTGQTGPLQQKIPCFSKKLLIVLYFLGICAYFVNLKEGFDLLSIFCGSHPQIRSLFSIFSYKCFV